MICLLLYIATMNEIIGESSFGFIIKSPEKFLKLKRKADWASQKEYDTFPI